MIERESLQCPVCEWFRIGPVSFVWRCKGRKPRVLCSERISQCGRRGKSYAAPLLGIQVARRVFLFDREGFAPTWRSFGKHLSVAAWTLLDECGPRQFPLPLLSFLLSSRHNLSKKSRYSIDTVFKTIALLSEKTVFAYLGVVAAVGVGKEFSRCFRVYVHPSCRCIYREEDGDLLLCMEDTFLCPFL